MTEICSRALWVVTLLLLSNSTWAEQKHGKDLDVGKAAREELRRNWVDFSIKVDAEPGDGVIRVGDKGGKREESPTSKPTTSGTDKVTSKGFGYDESKKGEPFKVGASSDRGNFQFTFDGDKMSGGPCNGDTSDPNKNINITSIKDAASGQNLTANQAQTAIASGRPVYMTYTDARGRTQTELMGASRAGGS